MRAPGHRDDYAAAVAQRSCSTGDVIQFIPMVPMSNVGQWQQVGHSRHWGEPLATKTSGALRTLAAPGY
jgi:hypothetical protein